jgi:cytochrome c peroxidase
MRRCLCAAIAVWAAAVILRASAPRLPLGLDLYRPEPSDNVLTEQKVALGRRLFFDRRLARDGRLSCADCHDSRRAFTNGRARARGVGGALGDRNVPTLVNRAWGASFFWDGRAATLEQQALEPILNPRELASTEALILARIRSPYYASSFRAAFHRDATFVDVGRALASFVRTIVSGNSAYDRFVAGTVSSMDPPARRGMLLFTGKGGCSVCHTGPLFTDEQFHNTGVAWLTGSPSDAGRAAVTGNDNERGAFKTPTLRNVVQTAPYMHDGSFATLSEVIDFYDRGGHPNRGLDPRLRPLHLTEGEKGDLMSFLAALTGEVSAGR